MFTDSLNRTKVRGREGVPEPWIATGMSYRGIEDQGLSRPHGDLDLVLRETEVVKDVVVSLFGLSLWTDEDDTGKVEICIYVSRGPVVLPDRKSSTELIGGGLIGPLHRFVVGTARLGNRYRKVNKL